MTYEEVEGKIKGLLENPDTALTGAGELLEGIKADYMTLESMTEKSERDEAKIRDLQDTNMKLFLSQTGNSGGKEEEEEEPEDTFASFIDNFKEEE